MSQHLPPLIEATLAVVQVLEDLEIRYLVGGSLASSAYGEVRTTEDADIVVDLSARQATALIQRLLPAFYADEERALAAVARHASFNVIHMPTMSKIDLFVASEDSVARRQFARRRSMAMAGAPQVNLIVASAEDVIVQKLRWYRMGNEVSERQWRDAGGVARIQGKSLDREYLRETAEELGVSDLLQQLFDEFPG